MEGHFMNDQTQIKTCTVVLRGPKHGKKEGENCDRDHESLGFCSSHLARAQRNGGDPKAEEPLVEIGQEARGHARANRRTAHREARLLELGFDDYSHYLDSPRWQETRARYLAADPGEWCRVCHATTDLELHHKTYDRIGEELVTDLMLLCKWCHEAVHELERQGEMGLDLRILGGSPTDIAATIEGHRKRKGEAELERFRERAIEYLLNDPVKKRRATERPNEESEQHVENLPAADDLASLWDIGSSRALENGGRRQTPLD